MRKLILILSMFAVFQVHASSTGPELHAAKIDMTDKASLQRGAKYFVNYCISCHSAKQMRYSRVGQDLGISNELVQSNLMFNGENIFDGMNVAMTAKDGEKWFGVSPPDLSLIARSRGADWLYSYLTSFYIDEERPFGVDNLLFSKVGMPHVLADLQGMQKIVYKEVETDEGGVKQVFDRFELVKAGVMSEEEYQVAVNDLVAFMVYVGEPAKLERQAMGWKVLLFILGMTAVFYALKKDYWRDIH
ncbi:MAG: cytochrome C [Cycloclasticus sp. symbiont of Poecilosclerida sp. M]|nr:MAG: cytochrome C [Cycloclasticus sp. symbiont of Poecilosclerida sp. M]